MLVLNNAINTVDVEQLLAVNESATPGIGKDYVREEGSSWSVVACEILA